jgi:anti-sigma factor RsiW
MTLDLHPPSDELLSAWLDGELDETTAARVQAWLQLHPQDAARVRLWAADRDALRSRLDAQLHEPPAPHWATWVASAGHAPAGPWRWAQGPALAAMLALASGLAGGAGGVWWARQHGPSTASATAVAAPWPRFAAAAHAVYVPEQKHPVEVAVEGDAAAQRAQEEHLTRWLTRRLDVPVKMFDLRAQGFRLVGGRLLPEGNGPCAQLMYEDDAGVRVTVYLRRKGTDSPAAFRYESVDGLGLFYWVDGPAGYALVGALPRDRLLALAEAIAHQEPP